MFDQPLSATSKYRTVLTKLRERRQQLSTKHKDKKSKRKKFRRRKARSVFRDFGESLKSVKLGHKKRSFRRMMTGNYRINPKLLHLLHRKKIPMKSVQKLSGEKHNIGENKYAKKKPVNTSGGKQKNRKFRPKLQKRKKKIFRAKTSTTNQPSTIRARTTAKNILTTMTTSITLRSTSKQQLPKTTRLPKTGLLKRNRKPTIINKGKRGSNKIFRKKKKPQKTKKKKKSKKTKVKSSTAPGWSEFLKKIPRNLKLKKKFRLPGSNQVGKTIIIAGVFFLINSPIKDSNIDNRKNNNFGTYCILLP